MIHECGRYVDQKNTSKGIFTVSVKITQVDIYSGLFPQGYKLRNAYIAAQAPLQETVSDFWRMIWEFKSKAIVMLCNFEESGQVSS